MTRERKLQTVRITILVIASALSGLLWAWLGRGRPQSGPLIFVESFITGLVFTPAVMYLTRVTKRP